MLKKIVLSAVLSTLGWGAVANAKSAKTPYESVQIACTQLVPAGVMMYEMYRDEVPLELAQEILLMTDSITGWQRNFLYVMLNITYSVPQDKMVPLEGYMNTFYTACVREIDSGYMHLPAYPNTERERG